MNGDIFQWKTAKFKSIPVSLGLLLLDVFGIYLAFYLATWARKLLIPWMGGEVYWPVYRPVVFLSMGFAVVFFALFQLYPGYGLTAVEEIKQIVTLLTLVFSFLAVSVYILQAYKFFPRSIFLFAWVFSLFEVPIGRFFLRNRLSLLPWYGFPVFYVAGSAAHTRGLEAVQNCRRMGWRPLAALILGGTDEAISADLNVPMIRSWEKLRSLKQQHAVDTVLVAVSSLQGDGDMLRDLSEDYDYKRLILIYPGDALGSVWVQPRDLEGYLGLELRYHLLEPSAVFLKGLLDYLLGGLLFLLLSPLLVLIALLIRLDSPGPVFFRQERLGKSFQRFNVLKFRTMVIDAEERLKKLLERDTKVWLEYQRYHKLEDDPRVTRMGRWLRKFSLDELPQLWNVLRGEMSLVGPRAYMPSECDDMGDYAEMILRVKPGLTGWWQVMGRHEKSFQRRLELDQYYISNWSLWMDLYVLIKTGWIVITGQGA
jgi:Undecaprenyl-phosphate galactose phosphotransferase WbaP